MARHLITSALPYINGIKHLGNMVGSMLPADVYSRYLRQRGHDVLYICATDEHGTPAELAAKERGLPVAEFCAQAHDAQKAVYDGFELAFDYFGRSSSQQNVEITQHFARKLNENGFIEERAIRQVYSPPTVGSSPTATWRAPARTAVTTRHAATSARTARASWTRPT